MEKIKDIKLMFIFFCLILLLGILVYCSEERIIIIKNTFTTIEVGKNYKDPGAYVLKNFTIVKMNIKTFSNLNINKLGKYKIIYQINTKGKIKKKIRYITVKDNTKPIIRLNGSEETIICPKSKYIEEGFEAVDNYDNDITKKVKITKNNNIISYKVRDSSGNSRTKLRKIKIKDIEIPILKLKGNKEVNIVLGNKYIDEGVIVNDNCDKNLKSNIRKEGIVNTKKLGKYEIIYHVKDNLGNKTSITRIVNVIKEPKKVGKIIYLTFDDGPSLTNTNQILDILKSEKTKATFFVINHEPITDYLIKRIDTEGHSLGLHSYSHNYSEIYSSNKSFFTDLEKIETKVYNITGKKVKITRFPGGSSNTISRRYKYGIMSELTLEVRNKGYQYFDWNVDSKDAGSAKTPEEIYNNVISNLTEKENIVLMHDTKNHNNTVIALKWIIKYGKENGYTFDKLDIDSFPAYQRVSN
jgi:Predicted xylanase/chitin deacetylase